MRPLVRDGYNAREIAGMLGIRRRRVIRIARRAGLDLTQGGDGRLLRIQIRRQFVDALDRVAGEAEVSRAVLVERLLGAAFEGDGASARRLLGKLAHPPRSYRQRRRPAPRAAS